MIGTKTKEIFYIETNIGKFEVDGLNKSEQEICDEFNKQFEEQGITQYKCVMNNDKVGVTWENPH